MSITKEQLQIALMIDKKVKQVIHKGGDDTAILIELVDLMPKFKHILDTAGTEVMNQLCEKYDDFYHYAKILERLASDISSGRI